MVSIVIPIYNEEKILRENADRFKGLSQHAEVIFVDGQSSDRSVETASTYGRVLRCPKGRAVQMNYGAACAMHGILLFLHADNRINADTLLAVENEISKNNMVGGCLSQQIEKKGAIYRIIEAYGNIRARLSKVFYGDQGIFVKKDTFFQLGGFPEAPIMEDIIFTKRLRKAGKTMVLSDKIFISARRWDKEGTMRTILRYSLISLVFKLGCPLEKIKLFYDDLR